MKNKSRVIIVLTVFILMILISSFSSIVNFITEYMWFKELGYTKTFLTKLVTQFKIGIPVFLALFIFISFYLKALKSSYYKKMNIVSFKDTEKTLNTVLYIASLVVSLFISYIFAGSLWFTVLKFMNSTRFNINDPIFNKDLSFYIFKLPLLNEVMNLLMLLVFLLLILTIGFYLIMFAVRRPNDEDTPEFFDIGYGRRELGNLFKNKIFKSALMQIGIAGFIIFLIIGVNYVLKSYYILYSPRGKVFGAGYTDVHVTLWVYRVMAVASLISAVGFLIGIMKRKIKTALIGPVLIIIISIIGNISAGVVEKFIVEPDQISKELPYIEHNIQFTQKAYGLDNVLEKDFKVNGDLTKEDLLKNEETIKNIRINDYRPIKQVYFQLQGIRLTTVLMI